MKLTELMAKYPLPSQSFEGFVTSDDWVLAVGINGEDLESTLFATTFVVVEVGIEGLDSSMNPVTVDNQYIRAGQSTIKTGTQRTFTVTGDRYIGDEFQDFAFSHKIAYGTGQDVVVPYVFFNLKNGKGEAGYVSIIVNSDASGNAGDNATISIDLRKTGPKPIEYTYTITTE